MLLLVSYFLLFSSICYIDTILQKQPRDKSCCKNIWWFEHLLLVFLVWFWQYDTGWMCRIDVDCVMRDSVRCVLTDPINGVGVIQKTRVVRRGDLHTDTMTRIPDI